MTIPARPKLVIFAHPASAHDFAQIPARFPQVTVQIEETPEGFEKAVRRADIVCIARKYKRSTILQARQLRWLHVGGTGVDRLHPLEELEPTLIITNTPALNADMMADYVVCAILMLTWDFPRLMRNQAARIWESWGTDRVAGKVVTLVGLGGIGRPIVSRISALGLRAVGVRQSAEPVPGVEQVFAPDQLHEALAAGDYVVLTVPLTPKTLGLIGTRELQVMKRSAFLINVCRGKIVQEPALVRALREGDIAGAALDVFVEEPLPPDSELWGLDNVIATPHISSWGTDYRHRAVKVLMDNLDRYLAGQPLLHQIDRQRGY